MQLCSVVWVTSGESERGLWGCAALQQLVKGIGSGMRCCLCSQLAGTSIFTPLQYHSFEHESLAHSHPFQQPPSFSPPPHPPHLFSAPALQSSTLYNNNIVKFLLSMGPFTSQKKGEFAIDYKDEAVRGALVLDDGTVTWPPPPPPPPSPEALKAAQV